MSTVLAAAREVVAAAGHRFYVQANVDVGPFSMAAVLRGAQPWFLDLSTESPDVINELLEFCTGVAIAYGKAMIETGVHAIQFGEATASLVSPSFFQTFVLPWVRRLLESLAGRGADLWLHICGKTSHILPLLRGLPLQGFEVDAAVPLAAARSLLGEHMALKGNLDTTLLLRGSAQEVLRASRQLLRDSGLLSGLIFSPGCAAPRGTPLENLRAMVQAVEAPRAEV
jgi:MtaA/CmuA family methyltransferase